MRVYTVPCAGDACELSMSEYYCMNFCETNGDPKRFQKILEEEGLADKYVSLRGPTIEDLQKLTSQDLTVLKTTEVYQRLFQGQESQWDLNRLKRRLRILIEGRLNGGLGDDYTDCYFIGRGDTFRLHRRDGICFNGVDGFRTGSDEAIRAIAEIAGQVAAKLNQEVEVEGDALKLYLTQGL